MSFRRRDFGIAALTPLLAVATACSKTDSQRFPSPDDKNFPGQFSVAGRKYLLGEPGVIHDDAVRYSADAGARTFDFNNRTLTTSLFVGTIEPFKSLKPAERQEVMDIAQGAIEFIHNVEKAKSPLPDSLWKHQQILTRFLADQRSLPRLQPIPKTVPEPH